MDLLEGNLRRKSELCALKFNLCQVERNKLEVSISKIDRDTAFWKKKNISWVKKKHRQTTFLPVLGLQAQKLGLSGPKFNSFIPGPVPISR